MDNGSLTEISVSKRNVFNTDNFAVDVRNVTKHYKIRHQKNPVLKDVILQRKDSYEEFLALDHISFSVMHGETFGIIGPNGSGKSTLLKLIAKVLQPTSGEVIVNGTVSALLELGAGFHLDLTGKENVYLNAAILGMKKKEIDKRFHEIVEFSELERFIDMPIKNYSSGMYMRLGFSIAINVNPDILLVDEVLAVGDQSFQSKCYKVIYDFVRKGKTIIIVSHDLETISDLCQKVIFLKNGKIEDTGDSIKVVSKYRAFVEELERQRIIEQQRIERKKIFKSIIDNKRKVVDGDEIDKLSKLGGSDDMENRFGSGDAEITKIELLNPEGKLVDFCKFGDDVKITFHVKFNNDVDNPIFGIRIADHRNVVVYGTNNKLNRVKSDYYKKGDLLTVSFQQKINLIGGDYFVSPSVGNKDTKTYCDWVNNMMTINVIHHNRAEGIADLNSRVYIERK
ncbi:MAG: ABC transporter ATP-binding protein [Actinobacteria bacterium]|nr:ABC transporter ATP-binding protein [Actinomycetota bacterium]